MTEEPYSGGSGSDDLGSDDLGSDGSSSDGSPFHALNRVNALIRRRIEVSAPGYWAVQRVLVRRMLATRARRARDAS